MKDKNYLFGVHPCLEALRAGKELERVFLKRGLTGEHLPEILKLLKETETPYQFVPMEKLNRITMKNHQGIIAYAAMVSYSPVEEIVQRVFEDGGIPLIVALDGITDVRNLGAIARSAEIAGAHCLLVPDKGSAQINPEAMKSSAGALNILPVARTTNMFKTLRELRDSGLKIVGATEKAADYIYDVPLKDPLVLVMGSEDTGLTDHVLKVCDHLAKIPQVGKVGSLNVSAASAVFLFEVVRQRLEK